jgi:hypothetical protein
VHVPVISGHRINDPATACGMIADGLCDIMAMGRPLNADPYLPEKAKGGRAKEIFGLKVLARLLDIPGKFDLAINAIPTDLDTESQDVLKTQNHLKLALESIGSTLIQLSPC